MSAQGWDVHPRRPFPMWAVVLVAVGLAVLLAGAALVVALTHGSSPTAAPAPVTTAAPAPITTAPTPVPVAPTEPATTISDQAFLSTTAVQNLTYRATDAEAINLGHAICQDLATGRSMLSEAKVLEQTRTALGQFFSPHDAGVYVGAAFVAYCPGAPTTIVRAGEL